ncbi:MAG: ATP-binding cassette domain-containing protein, partial [Planctomycetota bacterium]
MAPSTSVPNPQTRKAPAGEDAGHREPPLLQVQNLVVRYPVWGGILRHKVAEVRAVDGVSFDVLPGETLGLVGESGCGKTTIAKAIINILRDTVPGVVVNGRIEFASEQGVVNLVDLSRRRMRPLRREIQMIFQDPFSSLNPRLTVGEIIARPLVVHTSLTAAQRRERVAEL